MVKSKQKAGSKKSSQSSNHRSNGHRKKTQAGQRNKACDSNNSGKAGSNGSVRTRSSQSSNHRSNGHRERTRAGQRKQQPTNDADDSNNSDRGGQTEWEIYSASLTEERVLELGLEFANYTEYHRKRVCIETNQRHLHERNLLDAPKVHITMMDTFGAHQ